MISMFGRGFDSRQLHIKATDKHPRKGVFALSEPMKTCFQKVSEKAKEPCTAGCLFVIFRTEAKGSMSEANYPPDVKVKVKVKTETERRMAVAFYLQYWNLGTVSIAHPRQLIRVPTIIRE
jgi:hypothetical protein